MYEAPKQFFITPVLPYDSAGEIDEEQYRSLLRRFLTPELISAGAALIANPEAGEVFYLSREEKRHVVEIAINESAGRVPVYAGCIATTTAGTVSVAKDANALGVDGLFVMPPIGALDVTTSWDSAAYPEVFIDLLKAITAEVDLPMIVHPTGKPSPNYGIGLSAETTRAVIANVPQVVGWKMTYNYDGYREISRVLRASDRPVSILGAAAVYFHENLAADAFDGTCTGSWTYGLEAMFDHITAWQQGDIAKAQNIWEGGLAQLQEYVYSENSRLHVRYKAAAWLRGFIESPIMRAPLPRPKREEVSNLRLLLSNLGLPIISQASVDEFFNRYIHESL